MSGIKETSELVKGMGKAFVVLVKKFKDGVQTEDFPGILQELATDPDFISGIKDMQKIPGEVGDLSFFESLELAKSFLSILPAIVQTIKEK